MTNAQKLLAWIGLGAAGLSIAALAMTTRSAEAAHPESVENPPRVCVAATAGGAAEPAGFHPATLTLVLASTPDAEKTLTELEEQLDRAEESANPMALDLDAADPSDQKRLIRGLWPRVTAAQAWLRPELERKGHALVSCSDPSARYSLWGEQSGLPPAPPALRHQAWGTATLALIRSGEAPRLAARLRVRSAEPGTAIALVIGPLTRVDGLSRLAVRAKRLAERARAAGRSTPPLLAMLALATDAGDAPIPLGAGDLAVVPRLGALVRLAEFTTEIEGALGAGDRFVHRPEPIVSDPKSELR